METLESPIASRHDNNVSSKQYFSTYGRLGLGLGLIWLCRLHGDSRVFSLFDSVELDHYKQISYVSIYARIATHRENRSSAEKVETYIELGIRQRTRITFVCGHVLLVGKRQELHVRNSGACSTGRKGTADKETYPNCRKCSTLRRYRSQTAHTCMQDG